MTHGRGPVNDRGTSPGGDAPHSLTQRSPGARGLFQLVLNPECGTLQAYRLTQRDPALVAEVVLGSPTPDEGSIIALGTGLQFEAVLKKDAFTVLIAALVERGRLAAGDVRVLDIDVAAPGTDEAALAEKVRLTERALAQHAAGDPDVPDLIWHPRLVLDLRDIVSDFAGNALVVIEPDFIVTARPRRAPRAAPRSIVPLRPGEVKILRDRGARTAPEALRQARLQSAVEVLALRSTMQRLGVADPTVYVPSGADLVLRRRIGMRPSVRPCRLDAEIDALERVIRSAAGSLGVVLAAVPAGETLDSAAAFASMPKHFTEHCRDHCALAAQCERQARERGDAAILGDEVAELLGAMPIPRLLALLTGQAHPSSDAERQMLRGFRQAQARVAPIIGIADAELFAAPPAQAAEVRRAS